MPSAKTSNAPQTSITSLLDAKRMESIEGVQRDARGKLEYVTNWVDRKSGKRVKVNVGKEELRKVEARVGSKMATEFLLTVTRQIALNSHMESMK